MILVRGEMESQKQTEDTGLNIILPHQMELQLGEGKDFQIIRMQKNG